MFQFPSKKSKYLCLEKGQEYIGTKRCNFKRRNLCHRTFNSILKMRNITNHCIPEMRTKQRYVKISSVGKWVRPRKELQMALNDGHGCLLWRKRCWNALRTWKRKRSPLLHHLTTKANADQIRIIDHKRIVPFHYRQFFVKN